MIQHLGVQILPRGPKDARSTDDGLLWFVTAPEYYEYRGRERLEKDVDRAVDRGARPRLPREVGAPAPGEFPDLSDLEARIERGGVVPRLEAVQRLPARSPGMRPSTGDGPALEGAPERRSTSPRERDSPRAGPDHLKFTKVYIATRAISYS